MARATDYRLTGHRSQVIHRVGCRVLAKALGRLAVRRRQDARADQRRPRPDDRPAPLLPGLLPRREDPGVAGAALREARLWAPPLEPRPRPRPPLLPERPARERPMSLFAALFALLYVASYSLTIAVTVLTAGALGGFLADLGAVPWWRRLVAAAANWAVHSVIDRRWPVRRLMEATGSRTFHGNGGAQHVDQTLHLLTLLLLA